MSKVYYLSEVHSHRPMDFLYAVEAYDFTDDEIIELLEDNFGHKYDNDELYQIMKRFRKEMYYASKS